MVRLINILGVVLFSISASAQNWMNPQRYPKNCQPTYYLNARVIERKDRAHVKITQKSIGFAGIGFVELTTSAGKENLPIVGDGFLDIFVKKTKTKDGYDYWKECSQKSKN